MDLPNRAATDRAVDPDDLDYSFDVDLGELIPGHHVVARGIGQAPKVQLGPSEKTDLPQHVTDHVEASNRTPRDQVHFEHVPGLAPGHVTPDWLFTVSDDVGTAYSGVDEGAYDGHSGGAATHAVRELGGKIPPMASRLTLHFVPGHDGTGGPWRPPEPWLRELVIDLRTGTPAT